MRRDSDDPFDDFFSEIERMMEEMMGLGRRAGAVDDDTTDTHVDVHAYDDRIVVIADLPGVGKEEIDLKCDGQTLSIAATSDTRKYAEQLRLPGTVDESSATATYNNGILEVEFDRAIDSANIDID